MSNYDDVNYYKERLEDFIVWLAGEKIHFCIRQANGIFKPFPSGDVLSAYQDHRESVMRVGTVSNGCNTIPPEEPEQKPARKKKPKVDQE